MALPFLGSLPQGGGGGGGVKGYAEVVRGVRVRGRLKAFLRESVDLLVETEGSLAREIWAMTPDTKRKTGDGWLRREGGELPGRRPNTLAGFMAPDRTPDEFSVLVATVPHDEERTGMRGAEERRRRGEGEGARGRDDRSSCSRPAPGRDNRRNRTLDGSRSQPLANTVVRVA